MSYHLQVVRTSDFLKLDHHGKSDMERSREALRHLARECIEKGIHCALLDIRDLQPGGMSLTEVYTLARTFHEIGFQRSHRLAILHRYAGGDRAEFFAMTVAERGWNVQAFDEYEDAMEWFATAWPAE